jgi:GalNAc-alpha-(1->4)-GalNAc-alpha-(1->3)-diNAcBac-PP-undecaprenol alpha-1,4-N-acetyl-D-galactosaminyltransferase
MACGLSVVSFDCPTGPREIIRDGIDGILVPANETAALAQAMDRLMGGEQERRRLAARAIEVAERFGVARVDAMWRKVLNQAAS